MARRAKVIPVTIKGFGEDAGTEHTLEFAGIEGDRIILNFVNPLNRDQYITVPFRAKDGFAVGGKPDRGYRIPKSVRQELTALAENGKLDQEDVVGEKPRKAGKTMKVKVAGNKTATKTKGKAVAEESKNGSKPEAKKTKSVAAAKANVKGTAEEKGRPGRKPSIDRPEPGKREMSLKLSAGVYEELLTAKKLGPELKAAVKAAVKDGAYFLIILNKETASTLIEVFTKANAGWSGVRGARLREGVKRIAGEINERFRIKVPAELSNGSTAKAPSAAVSKPAPSKSTKDAKPKAKAAIADDEDDDDEEEAPKPKKSKKLKKTGKKSKKG